MKKLLLVSLCFLMLCITQVFAQNRTVTGTVTAQEDGLPIPGVTVKVKGTTNSTASNVAGKYTLQGVAPGATLVFSFIGYNAVQIPATKDVVNAVLTLSANQLGEVVVTTALGIKQPARTLGYSTAKVTAQELTATNVTNLANGLTGKVAGLAVYSLDAGVDPNVAIVLRGNRSLEGNNNALIVLDGVPIPGATLSSINPNDVAESTILKGAGAAALYGSEASNGAVIITTKRGTGDGKPVITYQNSFQVEQVSFYPKLQTQFGPYGGETAPFPDPSKGGALTPAIDPLTGAPAYIPYENQEYGPAYNGALVPIGAPAGSATGPVQMVKYSPYKTSPIKQFFQTGFTEQNDISFSQGDSKNAFFISAQNVYRTTVVPEDKNIKNAFSVRGHRTYGIFSADFSVGYTKTSVSTYNSGTSNTLGGVPGLTGSYVTSAGAADLYSSILQLPAFLNLSTIKDPNGQFGNVNDFYDAYAINPYWTINNSRRDITKDVLLSQLKLKLEPTKWLAASYQISDNFGINNERQTQKEVDFSAYGISDYFGAGNVPSAFASGKALGQVNDFYSYGDGANNPYPGYSRIQGDAVIDLHYKFVKDLTTSLVVGNSIRQQYLKEMGIGSKNVLIPDYYNVNTISGTISANEASYMIRNISFFGDLNVGWKNYLNFEATLRHEDDSRLSKAERSFYYPSAKLSFIPTDAISFLKDNKILNYAKIYGSFSRVGNIDIGPYTIYNVYNLAPGFPYGSLGGLTAGTVNFSPTLKPELTTEVELGAELSFFQSRLTLNAAYYDQHVKNQTVQIGTSITTGYSASLINIGETQSSGGEFQLTGQILTQAQNKVGWQVGGNFSVNNSKVISLLPNVPFLPLGNRQFAVVGQPFPLLEGTDFVRDPATQKVIVSSTTGYPSAGPSNTIYGRTTPKYNLGVNTNVSYKFVTLSALAEYRGGYVTYNGIGSTLDFTGSGYTSASAGRQVFVFPNSEYKNAAGALVPNTNVNILNGNYGFWQGSAYATVDYPYISSGSFWKLREVNLTFNLDQFAKKTKFLKGASLALTGRNLFLWAPKNNPWTDPEFSDSSPNSNLRGVNDIRETPSTRTYGGSLKLTF